MSKEKETSVNFSVNNYERAEEYHWSNFAPEESKATTTSALPRYVDDPVVISNPQTRAENRIYELNRSLKQD